MARTQPEGSTTSIPHHTGEDEDARLAEFGYEQKLDRSVGKIASFAIGFSTISATTAVFTGFGAGYSNAGAPFIWTLFLAVPVFLLWTLIAADVAAKIPLAGYAYQWTSRMNGSHRSRTTCACASRPGARSPTPAWTPTCANVASHRS